MSHKKLFQFHSDELNEELIRLVKEAGIAHFIDENRVVHYSAGDQEVVENHLICAIRAKVFPSWQILTCPKDWVGRYRDYVSHHDIPCQEEWSDGEPWFLIPRKYRPHLWKLDGASEKKKRLAKSQA